MKLKRGAISVPEDQDMSSGLELSSTAGVSDLADFGNLTQLSNLQKEREERLAEMGSKEVISVRSHLIFNIQHGKYLSVE